MFDFFITELPGGKSIAISLEELVLLKSWHTEMGGDNFDQVDE